MNWGASPRAAGHGLQRRGRDLHRPLRRLDRPGATTPPTWPGPPTACARWSALATGIQLADENLGRAPGALRQRRATSPGSTSSAAQLRPGRPVPPPGWAARERRSTPLPRAPDDAAGAGVLDGDRTGPIDPARRARRAPTRPPARPGAAARRERLVHAAGRRGLRGRAHGDARRERGDGRLVVRLAPGRRRCATASGTRGPTIANSRRATGRPRAPSPTGGPSITPSRTSAPAWCTRGSSSSPPSELGLLDATRSTTRAWPRSSAAGRATTGRRVRHTPMVHVFLRRRRRRGAAQPLLARRRAAPIRRPHRSQRRSAGCSTTGFVRGRALPTAPRAALARHCAEEYANLGRAAAGALRRYG